MSDLKVTPFKPKPRLSAAVIHVTEPQPLPPGPFLVTIADAGGKMWEFSFPSPSGDLPDDASIMGTAGDGMIELAVDLLTGALRAVAGRAVCP